MDNSSILAGDIGGTKSNLALYCATGELLQKTTYQNHDFSSLREVINAFLTGQEQTPVRECFGVAGPIRKNRVRMTNLDWVIDGNKLASHFAFDKVILVNDLVATTAGAVRLPADSLVAINDGHPDPDGAIGVLAVGTGLGECFGVPVNKRILAFPSEGGHSSFAPRTTEQIGLLKFMLRHKEHVSVERVCSGTAIPDLYAYMVTCCPEPEWLRNDLKKTEPAQHTPLIVRAANEALAGGTPCEPAVRAIELFVDILAGEAANLALKVLATGGIYLGGGMVPRVQAFFDQQRFMNIFCRGVYRQLLEDIPVHIIQDPATALIGAREIALAEP